MAKEDDELPRWAKIVIAVFVIGVLIWAFVPKEVIYISIGVAVLIIGAVSYLVYKKKGIEPFKLFGKKAFKTVTEADKPVQSTASKISSLAENERTELMRMVGNRCENPRCRNPYFPRLEIHHIIPRYQPGSSNRLTNLLVLCPNCHELANNNSPGKGLQKQWARDPRRFKGYQGGHWKYRY